MRINILLFPRYIDAFVCLGASPFVCNRLNGIYHPFDNLGAGRCARQISVYIYVCVCSFSIVPIFKSIPNKLLHHPNVLASHGKGQNVRYHPLDSREEAAGGRLISRPLRYHAPPPKSDFIDVVSTDLFTPTLEYYPLIG